MKVNQQSPHEEAGTPVVEYGRPRPYIDPTGGPRLGELEPSRWKPRGACMDQPWQLWFADTRSRWARQAIRVCHMCPVMDSCLASSLVYGDEFGIWGGLTAHAREPLTQRLRDGATLGEVLDSARSARQGKGRVA